MLQNLSLAKVGLTDPTLSPSLAGTNELLCQLARYSALCLTNYNQLQMGAYTDLLLACQ